LGEKCNKYFFNLEKRSYEKRHITKLKTPEGITAEDPKVILTVMKKFYNQLYTSQNQPSAERFSNFSDYESLPKLDNEKQNLCEGPITAEECLAALKTFQHSKTLGTDGLRDLSFITGGRAGANGGRVITFYATKKGRVTKNLSRGLGRAISFFCKNCCPLHSKHF